MDALSVDAYLRLSRWVNWVEEIKGEILCDEGRKRKIPVMVLDGFQRLAALNPI